MTRAENRRKCDHVGMSNFDPDELTISSLVGQDVILVPADATLREVAVRMADEGIGAIGVGDEELIGVVSERDIVRAVATDLDPSTPIGDIAERDLIWTDPSATVTEVANEMMTRWVRHIFVGQPGDLLGIVSIRDVLVAYVDITPAG